MKHHSTASGALLLALTLAASVCAAQNYAQTQATQAGHHLAASLAQNGGGNQGAIVQR